MERKKRKEKGSERRWSKEEQRKGRMLGEFVTSNLWYLANKVYPHQHQCTVSSFPLSILLLLGDREYTA